jgi:predicted HD phosphohydrolase
MAATFTRMDESTAEQWAVIGSETAKHQPRVADRILMLLRSLSDITDGFSTDQLTHCLQTATLAERAGADDEVVVASLCHDIGKAISVPNHGAIAAEMLRPYVRPDVFQAIYHHQDFQGRHYYQHFGLPTDLREQHRHESWFALCEQFTDDWDQVAFDPDGPTESLDHFEPLVRAVFASPKYR